MAEKLKFTWGISARLRELAELSVFAAIVIFVLFLGSVNLEYDWQWERIPDYLFLSEGDGLSAGPLLQGLAVTLKISFISTFLTVIIALVSALLRLSDSFTGKMISYAYVETIRNTPLLIQIFFIYFVIAPIFGLSAFSSAVISLSLFEGAYASEIIRAGIMSISKGQWDAAYSLGFGKFKAYRYIILPQALRRVLPPLTGQGVSLIKDSALVSTISIFDLTMRGQEIISETFLTFEIWFTIALIYFVLTASLSRFSFYLEKRFEIT